MIAKTVLGVFTKRQNAESAISDLGSEGYDAEDISILMKDRRIREDLSESTSENVADGTAAGAATGVVLGGLAGLVAAIAVPGIGLFFVGGPIVSAFGLTGVAAASVSGAVTGALAGGVIGALTGFGLSDEEAKIYEEKIKEGAILLAVPAFAGEEERVEDILRQNNAGDIISVAPYEEEIGDVTEEEIFTFYNPSAVYSGAKGGRSSKKGKQAKKSKKKSSK